MSDRDLGTMGEREFEKKCASVGITANSSNIDRNGWDSILEINQSGVKASRMLDKFPPQIKCLVQVKATDSKTRNSWSIKLSNLKKLVDFAGAAFFVLMKFAGEEDVQEIYLVHVDESIARRVMKKLRELSLETKDPAKAKLTINFGNDLLHEPTGACIKEKIIGIIPDSDIDGYISKKQQVRKNIGYEAGRHRVTFTPKDADAAKAFSEAMLGMPVKVPVVNVVRQEDIRFDIPAAIIEEDEAIVSLEVHPNTVLEVFFQGKESSESIAFSADLYPAHLLKRVRFDFKVFDLMYNLDARTIDWNITHTDETVCSLDLLIRFYSLILMVAGGNPLRIGIEIEDKIQPFSEMLGEESVEEVSIISDKKKLGLCAKKILNNFFITDVLVRGILLNQQRLNLQIFAKALDGTLGSLTLTTPPVDGLFLEEKKKYTTIFPIIVYLGNYIFCAILKIKGCYVKDEGRCQCSSSELTLLETFHLAKKDADGVCEKLDLKLKVWMEKEDIKTTITINQMNRESEKSLFLDG